MWPYINFDPPGWGLDARLTNLLCKNYCETKRSENRMANLAEILMKPMV
jgi:hypothetical protein